MLQLLLHGYYVNVRGGGGVLFSPAIFGKKKEVFLSNMIVLSPYFFSPIVGSPPLFLLQLKN